MEPVGDLYCARCGTGHGLCIRSSAVPGNYLNAWMLANPLCYRLRRTPREYVHGPTGLKITQKGAIGSAASDGEVVNAQNPKRSGKAIRAINSPEKRA